MNHYAIAFLVFLSAILAAIGNDLVKGIQDWNIIAGDVALAAATAIAGILTRLPKREWSEDEREDRLGGKS